MPPPPASRWMGVLSHDAPCEALSAWAGHATAPAYMDAAPVSSLGLSFDPQAIAGSNPYDSYGHPTEYDLFGNTNPAVEPQSRAVSQISWAILVPPLHETHPVEDSVHIPPPAPIIPKPAPVLPAGPSEIPDFTKVSCSKKKGKGNPSFAEAAASLLPVSGIQCELAKINKSSSAPASIPSAPAIQSKKAKDKSPPPPRNLKLIIKVSTEEDCQLVLSWALMPESWCCLMCLVTHFNNIINSKEYRGKTSIMLVQFSYGTNSNCYISFLPATKIEEVELFCSALAFCINLSGPFVILDAGKWTKMMILHVLVQHTDPITGEEHHEINTKKDLMLLLQLFIPNDILDEFPVQDVHFLRPLSYVEKTSPGGHETIVLLVEDKSNQVFDTYKNHSLTFGY